MWPAVDYGDHGMTPINAVPFDRDVEIAVADSKGMHTIACPCCLTERGWIAAGSNRRLCWVRPTHWRELERSAAFPLAALP